MIGGNLGFARVERRHLLFQGARRVARRAACRKRRLDLGATGAERPYDLAGYALDLEHRVLARYDLITEFADLQRHFLPVDGADLFLKLVVGAGLEAAPCAIFVTRGLDNEVVRMKIGRANV